MILESPTDSEAPKAAPARPPLTGRIHYLIGGTLESRYHEWVQRDLTGPGWRHRQAMRPVLLMLPFAVAFALLPGSAQLRLSIPIGLLVWAVVIGYASGDYFRNCRLDQYGIARPRPVEEDEFESATSRSSADDEEEEEP